MGVDRRLFCAGFFMALTTAACGTSTSIQAKTSRSWWQDYRRRFLGADGRIIDNGNGGISHSEGQGYGMLLALAANDKDAFTSMAQWAERNLARSDVALFSWRFDPRSANPVSDRNNATDGDMLIAWALAQGGKRWKMQPFLDRSTEIRAAIRKKCVVKAFDRSLLLPGLDGFSGPKQVVINPSYFIWPALDAFARLDGPAVWKPVIDDSAAILNLAKFGPYRLPTDWLVVTGSRDIAPAEDKPPRFGFDAIRVTLYALIGRRPELTADITAFWRSRLLQRRPIPAWVDVVTSEEAPYPISSGGQAIASRLLGLPAPTALADDYYAATLQMLARADK